MDDFLIAAGWDGSPESDAAVHAAGKLAIRTNGRVRVVLAWDYLTQPARFDPHFDADDASRYVRLAARRLLPAQVPFEACAALGRPHEVLLEQAQQADLIVIGRSGLGRAFARLMGSTATDVVRAATIPVVVVPSDSEVASFTGRAGDGETGETANTVDEPSFDATMAMELLNVSQCWAFVRSAEVARVAVCSDGQPEIFPINYVVDRGSVVFRSAPGTKLAALANDQRVAFEVDGFDPEAGQAWSVVIKGDGTKIVHPPAVLEAAELPLFPWQAAPKPVFVRIEPTEVSGRQFRVINPHIHPE